MTAGRNRNDAYRRRHNKRRNDKKKAKNRAADKARRIELGETERPDKDVHYAAIVAAHRAIDPMWQRGILTRKFLYDELARRLDVSRTLCHMGRLPHVLLVEVPGTALLIEYEAHERYKK